MRQQYAKVFLLWMGCGASAAVAAELGFNFLAHAFWPFVTGASQSLIIVGGERERKFLVSEGFRALSSDDFSPEK